MCTWPILDEEPGREDNSFDRGPSCVLRFEAVIRFGGASIGDDSLVKAEFLEEIRLRVASAACSTIFGLGYVGREETTFSRKI